MRTQNDVAKDWSRRGFSCGLWVDPPAQVWENYEHEVAELVYVLEGILELEISGRKSILRAGDEAFIPERTKHTVRNIGGTEVRWLYGYKTDQT